MYLIGNTECNMNTVSIITASYNYAHCIGEAITSVLEQTFPDWELIIVDDGSKDNSLEVIKLFCEKDRRIKLFTHDGNANRGLCETLKLGISNASGKYIAFLESDDKWMPENLSKKIRVFDLHPEVALVDDEVELFGEKTLFSRYDDYWQIREKFFSHKSFPTNIFYGLFYENMIPTFSCAITRADALRECSFDYFYAPHLDRSLWLQICRKHFFFHINEKLTCWRIHSSSYITRENKSYRRNFLRKAYHLLLPCYNKKPYHPGFLFSLFMFIGCNILRAIRNKKSKTE